VSRVLVVDDDPRIRRLLEINLRARQFEVDLAADGEHALQLAARHHPDVVILDLGLPTIDGLDVVRGLRGWTSVPIVVVSGRGSERSKVEALDLGADDYLTKLEPDPTHPRYFITHTGMGYRFEAPPAEPG
jgi:two-component system KDP operon response regulator KdpE